VSFAAKDFLRNRKLLKECEEVITDNGNIPARDQPYIPRINFYRLKMRWNY